MNRPCPCEQFTQAINSYISTAEITDGKYSESFIKYCEMVKEICQKCTNINSTTMS